MTLARIESLLAERAIRRTGEFAAQGINSRSIQQALDAGVAVRPVMLADRGPLPGIIVSADADIDPDFDDALAMVLVPGGVIGRRTAAMRQGLGNGLPRVLEVLTPHEVTRMPVQANIHLMRSRRAAALREGVAARMTDLGIEVRMTTPARTVVDLFRSGQKVPDDQATAYAALATYIAKGGEGGEVKRLSRFFEESVQGVVEAAVEAATESLTKGYAA